MIEFNKLEEEWDLLNKAGAAPKCILLSSDRFEELLSTGKVRCFPNGYYYYRRVSQIVIFDMDELNAFLVEDGNLKALKDGMVDFL